MPDEWETIRRGVRRVETLGAVRSALAERGVPWERCLFSDLSLGSWRPRQIAAELLEQLGGALNLAEDRRSAVGATPRAPSIADLVGEGVDNEARGVGERLAAAADVGQVCGCLPGETGAIAVFLPRFGDPIGAENEAFLSRLVPRLPGRWELLVFEGISAPPEPELSLSGLGPEMVPGVVSARVTRLLSTNAGECAEIEGGCFLVRPEDRRPASSVPQRIWDRLAGLTEAEPWLHAYAQCSASGYYVRPQCLAEAAWRAFTAGSTDLALRLVDRARACAATPLDAAVMACHSQGMRIASLRFREVAEGPKPSPAWPRPLQAFLSQALGWGRTLLGEAEAAAGWFERAEELFGADQEPRERLYLQNIRALQTARLGDVETALEMELRIEEQHTALPHVDHRLTYINQLNTARLYRRLGRVEQAEQHFRTCLRTHLGVRSLSDHLFAEVTEAWIAGERGEQVAMERQWLRAALVWLAADVPEALAPRVATHLLGRPPDPDVDVVAAVSVRLVEALEPTGPSPAAQASAAIVDAAKCRWDEPPDVHLTAAGALLAGRGRTAAPSDSRLELRRLVSARLGLSPDLSGTIAVDDGLGCGIPEGPVGAVTLALRVDAAAIHCRAGRVPLTAELRRELVSGCRVLMGPAVDRIEGGTVHFRRQLPPRLLSEEEAGMLAELNPAGATVGDLELGKGVAALRRLELDRVVQVEATETVCARAGIR